MLVGSSGMGATGTAEAAGSKVVAHGFVAFGPEIGMGLGVTQVVLVCLCVRVSSVFFLFVCRLLGDAKSKHAQ